MKIAKIGRAMLVSIVFACSAALSQQAISPALLTELKAPEWQQRWAAYRKVTLDEDALKRQEVSAALVDLLDRENQLTRKTLLDSNGEIGVSAKYGEGYSEYKRQLLGTVEKIADWGDQNQLCILAQSSYNPDSPFAASLATRGGVTVAPCLLRMAENNFMFDRHKAIPVLVQLSAVTQDLSPALQQQIRQAIIRGLRDPEVAVRWVTVEAAGRFGTADMIPLLQEIARSDPHSRRLDSGQQRFEIRDMAARAIQSIQQRANAR